jgi:hypothetical protein
MTPGFYSDAEIERGRRVYLGIKAWGVQRRDVNLIGGWAVKEHVGPLAFESRDVDVILHTAEAFRSFNEKLPAWGLAWRKSGRRTFKECYLRGTDPFPPMVDVFTTDPSIGARLFSMLSGGNVKPSMGPTWLPSLEEILRDKVETVAVRRTADKSAKDLLDVWLLITHNREGKTPADLLGVATPEDRAAAARKVRDSAEAYPLFADRFRDVGRWLRRAK